jgi:hypothetical protein
MMFQPTMVQWVELLTKQFNASQAACEWFLDHMAHNEWWPVQILIKCPNQMVRQMFQRLCIHVIQRLRSVMMFPFTLCQYKYCIEDLLLYTECGNKMAAHRRENVVGGQKQFYVEG